MPQSLANPWVFTALPTTARSPWSYRVAYPSCRPEVLFLLSLKDNRVLLQVYLYRIIFFLHNLNSGIVKKGGFLEVRKCLCHVVEWHVFTDHLRITKAILWLNFPDRSLRDFFTFYLSLCYYHAIPPRCPREVVVSFCYTNLPSEMKLVYAKFKKSPLVAVICIIK